MEILLWLVPPIVVACAAMTWVSWLGRDSRGDIDRDEAIRKLGEALNRGTSRPQPPTGYAAREREPDRSTGIAVRPSQLRAAPPPHPESSGESDVRCVG